MMRIVQTFWSGGKSMLEDGFGWLHPEYHLMSWALSCLSLREHYDEVALYTDSEGKRLLIDTLHLPYSEVNVVYDGLSCPQPHWAYPKLLTYSLQTSPFIHVDSDVYVPRRLGTTIEQAPLVAQNREVGTEYYKGMARQLLQSSLNLPENLLAELHKDVISSYNAGFLGGNDLAFIHHYCQIAFDYIDKNHLNDVDCPHANVNDNILFEQILFAVLTRDEHKVVTTVLDYSMHDRGYTYDGFCNLINYDVQAFFHVLGGHKANEKVCEMLCKTLLRKYPEYYRQIIQLFPSLNQRFTEETDLHRVPDISVQASMAQYQDFLCDLNKKWSLLSTNELYLQEQKAARFPEFLKAKPEEQKDFHIEKNPYMVIYEIPKQWPKKAVELLLTRLSCKHCQKNHYDVVLLPTLLGQGTKELAITDLAYNILNVLDYTDMYGDLLQLLKPGFDKEINEQDGKSEELTMKEITFLLYHGVITIKY